MIDITSRIQRIVYDSKIEEGTVVVYIPHTTAGTTINENADPDVKKDILDSLDQQVPWEAGYSHAEGNSAAHVKAAMMGSSKTILISEGQLMLGVWQGIYFCEFDGPRNRKVWVEIIGK